VRLRLDDPNPLAQAVVVRVGVMVATVLLVCVGVEAAYAAPTKAEFIRKGDAVCRQTQRELVPLRKRAQAAKVLPQSEQWAATAAIYADQIRIQRRFVTRFRAIGTPAGNREAARLVSSLGRGVTLATQVQRGFAERDPNALSAALPAYLKYTLSLNRRVVAFGFRVCGR
jgi:hypothetical protein